MMTTLVVRFANDDSGATAIEYGLIAALMAVGCITAFVAFGGSLAGLFGYVDTRAGAAMNSAG
jgi:pilus assembly protein Flp/PilA